MKQFLMPVLLIILTIELLLLNFSSTVKPIYAQGCQASDLNQGLISATEGITGGGVFGNSQQICITGTEANPLLDASYRDFKVPTYDELENKFYNLSRSIAKKSNPRPNGDQIFDDDGIYLQPTSLNISKATGSGVQVIFIRGNLYITGNIDYAANDPYSGLVFIASGDINIDENVTKVNAVLISSGTICTAYTITTDSCLSGTGLPYTPQLVVNGSLISLNKTNIPSGLSAIELTRNLINNQNQPAELINKQAKYLYILRNGILTSDLIITQEDQQYVIPPAPPATPTPSPTPTPPPVCSGSTNPFVIGPPTDIKDVNDCIISI